MSDGIYVALSGAIARSEQLDTVANNLANASTRAFRPQRTSFRAVLATAGPAPGMPASSSAGKRIPVDRFHVVADVGEASFVQGTLRQTGRPFDLALEGDGWFSLATGRGRRYTRDGSFHRDGQGYLVAEDGARVLGRRGPLRLPPGPVEIDARGQVLYQGQVLDRLRVVSFAPGSRLVREGATRYRSNSPEQASGARLHQGMLEQSSVSAVGELISLVEIQRTFDALQEAIRAYRDMDNRAVAVARNG